MSSSSNNRAIYVLKLEAGKYYVGSLFSVSPDSQIADHPRILKHFNGQGAEWTKLHRPVELIETKFPVDEFEEDKQTKIYMSKYGIDNVRGGSYCEINLDEHQQYCLQKELDTAKGVCFRCGQAGHNIKQCRVVICYKCGEIGHYSSQCHK